MRRLLPVWWQTETQVRRRAHANRFRDPHRLACWLSPRDHASPASGRSPDRRVIEELIHERTKEPT